MKTLEAEYALRKGADPKAIYNLILKIVIKII